MPDLDARAQGFPGQIGVQRVVGDAPPGGVPGVAMAQRAVEMACEHGMRAVRADDGVGRPRR